jgi:hypothetical protein
MRVEMLTAWARGVVLGAGDAVATGVGVTIGVGDAVGTGVGAIEGVGEAGGGVGVGVKSPLGNPLIDTVRRSSGETAADSCSKT